MNACGPWTDPARTTTSTRKATTRGRGTRWVRRNPDTIRPAYLHGLLDLDPDQDGKAATTIHVEADGKAVDEPPDSDHVDTGAVENWYDNPPRHGTKLELDTDGMVTDGELWGAYPGMQEYELQLSKSDNKTRLETCIDVDVPLHFTWSDTSNLRFGVDAPKATLSLLDSEVVAGADATLAIEERMDSAFEGSPVETGIWVNELKTWFQPPTKDWFSGVWTDRMPLGFLDPDDPHLENAAPRHPERAGRSLPDGCVAGDGRQRRPLVRGGVPASVLPPRHRGGAVGGDEQRRRDRRVTGPEGLWTALDEKTDAITTWTLPALRATPAITDDTNTAFLHQTADKCITAERNANTRTCSRPAVSRVTARPSSWFAVGQRTRRALPRGLLRQR